MEVTLQMATPNDVNVIHHLQVQCFLPLLHNYQDYETNPANESIDQVYDRFNKRLC